MMTKKERARIERLLTECALRRTSEVLPDVPPPKSYTDPLTVGWHFNSYTMDVRQGCSSSGYHSIHSTTKTDSQLPKHFYSSKMLALRAMRYEIETRVARELRAADIKIEKEESECDNRATRKGH